MPIIGQAPIDQIAVISGSLVIIPSGSQTIGVSHSAAVAQTVEISMSANTNNFHTPIVGTGSYFTISGSQQLGDLYTFAYVRPEKVHKHRIITAPNSSSYSSSYGSQGGRFFDFTASRGEYVARKFRLWYSNPAFTTRAQGSVTITSFSGSQTIAGNNQYKFFLSGSNGKVFEFIPSHSVQPGLPYLPTNNGLTWPFEYYYTSSISNSFDEEGLEQRDVYFVSSSLSDGCQELVRIINNSASYFGVSATASSTTITFNAVQDGPLTDTLTFFTQSLTGTTRALKSFTITGGTHVTSSQPAHGGNDYLIEVPLSFTSSAYNVATASRNVINSRTHNSSSFISASVSGSDGNLYGLIITSQKGGFHPEPTGSTNPTFTYHIFQTGSKRIVPFDPASDDQVIEITVDTNETTANMISSSVIQINNFFRRGVSADVDSAITSGSIERYIVDDGYSTTIKMSASYCGNQNGFRLANTYGGKVGQPDMTNARTTASIVTSGSGLHGQGVAYGVLDISTAKFQIKKDTDDNASIIVSGSGNQKLYMSGSGNRIGFNTTDPQKELDFRADEMQFQRVSEQKGIRINRFGDIESYNFDGASAATGSELIMTYQRGGAGVLSVTQMASAVAATGLMSSEEAVDLINESHEGDTTRFLVNTFAPREQSLILDIARREGFFDQASVGDVIGSVRWVVNSGSADEDLDTRGAGESAYIKNIVTGVDDDLGGVTSKLDFAIAKVTGDPALKLFSIDPSAGIVCSASLVLKTGNPIVLGSAAVDGTDRVIQFRHSTSPIVMGIDDSADRFVINNSSNFDAGNDNTVEIGANMFVIGDNHSLNVTHYAAILGGVHVGGTSDPGDDNLIVDGTSLLTGNV